MKTDATPLVVLRKLRENGKRIPGYSEVELNDASAVERVQLHLTSDDRVTFDYGEFDGEIRSNAQLERLLNYGAQASAELCDALARAAELIQSGVHPGPLPRNFETRLHLEGLRWEMANYRAKHPEFLTKHDKACIEVLGYVFEEQNVSLPTFGASAQRLAEWYQARGIEHFTPVFVHRPKADGPLEFMPVTANSILPRSKQGEEVNAEVFWEMVLRNQFPVGASTTQVTGIPTSVHDDGHLTAGIDYPPYFSLLKKLAAWRIESFANAPDDMTRSMISYRAFAFLEHCQFIPKSEVQRVRDFFDADFAALPACDERREMIAEWAQQMSAGELFRVTEELCALGLQTVVPLGGLAREGEPGGGGPWIDTYRHQRVSANTLVDMTDVLLPLTELTPEKWLEGCMAQKMPPNAPLRYLYEKGLGDYGTGGWFADL